MRLTPYAARVLKVVTVGVWLNEEDPGTLPPYVRLCGWMRLRRGRWLGMLAVMDSDDVALVGKRLLINIVEAVSSSFLDKTVHRKMRQLLGEKWIQVVVYAGGRPT